MLFSSASKAFPDDASWPGLSTLLIFQGMFTLCQVNKFHTLLRQINLLGVLTRPRALQALPNADCCCLCTRRKQDQRAMTTGSRRMPPRYGRIGHKSPVLCFIASTYQPVCLTDQSRHAALPTIRRRVRADADMYTKTFVFFIRLMKVSFSLTEERRCRVGGLR